jgi:hypothetical protein
MFGEIRGDQYRAREWLMGELLRFGKTRPTEGSMSRIDLTQKGIDRSYYLCKHFFVFLLSALTSPSELLKSGVIWAEKAS